MALGAAPTKALADARVRTYVGAALEPARRWRLGVEQQWVAGDNVRWPGDFRTQMSLGYEPLSWLQLSVGQRLQAGYDEDRFELQSRLTFDAQLGFRRGPVRFDYRVRVQDTLGQKRRSYSHAPRLRNRLAVHWTLPAPVSLRLLGAAELYSDPSEMVALDAAFHRLRFEVGVSRRFGAFEVGASYRYTMPLVGNGDYDHRVLVGMQWHWEARDEARRARDPQRPRRRDRNHGSHSGRHRE